MKFKDYYQILNVSLGATNEEIKRAFKEEALKWHPDRNAGKDTTLQMQLINEAYLILRDSEARQRYNKEYQSYYEFVCGESKYSQSQENEKYSESAKQEEPKNESFEYEIKDDILAQWIRNAQKQAIELAKQTIEDIIGVSKAVSKGCLQGIGVVIFSSILSVLLSITCS
jgi:curved DNA-binding protein CbpA